jgi:hypothetical protein
MAVGTAVDSLIVENDRKWGDPREGAFPAPMSGVGAVVLLNSVIVLAYLVVQNRAVPAHNELVYLVHLAREWNPSLLATDWTFSGPLPSHVMFNVLFGPLTLWLPLEAVGWVGRFLCWSLILIALFRIGKHFEVPQWMITVALMCWLFYRQSIVGGEWILGPFEAKCIAYALLLFSLNGFMQQRGIVIPSILLGLAFSFHPLVGLWGGLAVIVALVAAKYPLEMLVKGGCYTAAFALPGLIPLLITPMGTGPDASAAWKFVALVVMPYHFDPLSFAPWKVGFLLALLGFNWFHFIAVRRTGAIRFLLLFQTVLGVFFGLGYLARLAENYTILQLMPCRLFPVLVPLFFFFHLMSTLHQSRSLRSGIGLLSMVILAVVVTGVPAKLSVDYLIRHRDLWTWREEDDLTKTFKWIALNTPADATVILPPWRKDTFYLAQRAQIANWWVVRFDRLAEWRQRLESMAGDLSSVTDGSEKGNMTQTVNHYDHLTEADIAALAEQYGADYLVSSSSYTYRVLFESGSYKVYSLRRQTSRRNTSFSVLAPHLVPAAIRAVGARRPQIIT